jgi:chromosome segregation ATPase
MLQGAESPDKDIAPLVYNWTKQLVSKADKAEQTLKEKDDLIESLEKDSKGLEIKLSDALSKVKKLQARLSTIGPSQDKVSALKAQIQQLTADKAAERQKVHKLNTQLSALIRQSRTEKKEYEKSMSRQPSMGEDDQVKDLKAKYEALDSLAKEVVRDCGMMAGENFGPIGMALLKLKKHMEE